jgi:hypothetical protein
VKSHSRLQGERLVQKIALIERVAMELFLNSSDPLNFLNSSSFVLVQSVTGQFQINIFQASRT